MWVKFKRRISRSKGYEADSPANSDSNRIVLKSFKRIPSSNVGFVEGDHPFNTEHPPLPREGSEACKCAPRLSFHKQLLGSFKNKKHNCSTDGSAPNAECDSLKGSSSAACKSPPMGHKNSIHSPKSTHQNCSSSPKRGCFNKGCVPNSEDYRYSPVQDQQSLNCSPKTRKQCHDVNQKSADQVYNNNDFKKDPEGSTKCLAASGPAYDRDEITSEIVKDYGSKTDVQEKGECLLEDAFKCLNMEVTGDELLYEKGKDTDDDIRILQNDIMTRSDIVSGVKVSPPKMKRREKVRPASAIETRRSHQHPGDLPARATKKLEVLCPVSGNCGTNTSDFLDDSVYCMDGMSVANAFCNRTDAKVIGHKSDLNAVEVSDDATNGVHSELCRPLLDFENSQGVVGEKGKTVMNNGCTYPDLDMDESSGKESGYTTLEDVQLLIGKAVSATKRLYNPAVGETGSKTALGNLDYVLDEIPLDYSMKHLKSNESKLNFDNFTETIQQVGVGLPSKCLEDSFSSSMHSEDILLSSVQSDYAFLPQKGALDGFYLPKQSGVEFILSKSFEGASSSSRSSRQLENMYMSSENTCLCSKQAEDLYVSSESAFSNSKQSENLYTSSDVTCELFPAQAPSVAKQSHAYQEEAFLTEVINLSKRNHDDNNYVRADGFRSQIFDPYVETDGTTSYRKLYALVPKSVQTSVHEDLGVLDAETLQSVNPESRSREKMYFPSSSWVEQQSGNGLSEVEERNDRVLEENDGTFDVNLEYDGAVESDDGEYLPPLPSRNYVTYANSSAVVVNNREKKFVNGALELNHEQTHMCWDEVMREAKSLGIPLNAPASESLGRVSSVSSMASSQMSLASEGRSSSPVLDPTMGYQSEGARGELSPSGVTQIGCSEMVPKRDGSSRERFRLQNLFSRKGRNNERSASPTNPGIQKRCLPPVPSSVVGPCFTSSHLSHSAHLPASSLGKSARRTMSNVHLPTGDRGSRSVWGSSMSVPAQCLSSANGSSGSVRSLISNISNGNGPASCSRSAHQGSFTVSSSPSSFVTNSSPGTNGDFIKSFIQLKECGWYWGPLGWENAEAKLADKPDGSFLVRDSSDDRYILSLSFRSQGITHHTRIEHYKGMFSFYSQPKSHGAATIVEFIEKAMEHSRNGKFLYFLRPRAPGLPPAPVQLLYPVSRMRSMHSLQHVCRFLIVRIVRRDLIDRLPIPPRLKEYLKQTQYYVEGDATSEHQYFNQDW